MSSSSIPRCAWTHRPSGDLKRIEVPAVDRFGRAAGEQTLYVQPEHEAELRRFFEHVNRYGRLFSGLMLLFGAVAVVLAIAGSLPEVGAVLLLLGITALVLPFCTPETIALVGARTAIRLARGVGLAAAVYGLALLLRLGL